MELEYTKDLPDKKGFYWWLTPTLEGPEMLEVTKDYRTGKFYAFNREYTFPIEEEEQLTLISEPLEDYEQKFFDKYGALDVWCYVPEPRLR